MVIWIGSSFIQKANRLAVQRHELALETNVSDLGDILLPVAPVIFEKEGDGRGGVPVSAIQRELKDICAGHWLRNFNGLCRGELGGSREVEVVAILEQLHGSRGGNCRRSVEEKGMDFDLAGEPVGFRLDLLFQFR